jgi:hypothetical protein
MSSARYGRRPDALHGPVVLVILAVALALGATGVAVAANGVGTPANTAALPGVVRAVEAARRGARIPTDLTPPLATIRMFPRRYRIPPACIAHDASSKTESKICRVGSPSSQQLLVLFGDSHAFMWLPAVLQMARHDGWAVVPLIRFGCTPGLWITHAGPDVCRAWYRWAFAQIRRLHPDVTLVGGSIGERPSFETRAATTGLVAAAQTLRHLGPLVVIGDPEGPAADPRGCVFGAHSSMATCMTTWPAASLLAYDTVRRAMGRLHVGFIPTRGFVCYQRQCPAVVGHTIVWMDNSHLTGVYSAELADPFRAAFLRAWP